MKIQPLPFILLVVLLAALYFAAAKLGLTMAFVADQVTAVWPPTGIALAAVLLFGNRVWPGIALGAFAANLSTGAAVPVALGITVGNTLEAVTGAWLLQRFLQFSNSLEQLKDALGLILLGAFASTTVSATIGVISLCLGGMEAWSDFAALWWVWWLGDAVGDLVVAPVILAVASALRVPPAGVRGRPAEAVLLLLLLLGINLVVFAGWLGTAAFEHPLEYVIFPLVIWSAVRFGQLGTSLVTFLAAAIAIWGTVNGSGPFAGESVSESLVLLQSYVAVVAATGLLLAAALNELDIIERRRAAHYAVSQALTQTSSLGEAAPHILQAICESLRWDVGALWGVDHRDKVLRCVEVWHESRVHAPEFLRVTRHRVFEPGVGLPGRVWSSGKPAWIADVTADTNFPRAPLAAGESLHGAFAFPIVIENEVHGVVEFFSREIRRPDGDMLALTATIGGQIGQFMERQHTEAELRRSEHELSDFFENAAVGLHWAGPDGIILRANQAELDLVGYPREEYVGRHVAEFHADRAAMEDILSRLHAGETIRAYEARLLCKDGSTKQVLIASSALWENGRFIHTRCFTRDITDRKRAEEALKEADRRKDEFLAMLSHELRNPLAPIRNAAQVLRVAGGDPTKVRWARDIIDRQVQQLGRLVDDLLDVSRITRGRIELRIEPVNLHDILERAVETSRPMIEGRKHELLLSLPPVTIRLEADPARLTQAFANLLINAAKYSEEGKRIWVTAEQCDHDVRVAVRDEGAGIPTDMLTEVFDLFAQGHRGLDRAQGGLGIGLTLVQKLVTLHGGSVEALSDGPGMGSEFVVRLPTLRRAATDTTAAGPCPAPAPPGQARILVVDDNIDAAETLATLLRLSGHDVRTAYDGLAALETTSRFNPEIVLLDIGLPGMDGYEVARELRDRRKADGLLLVALTGYGQAEDRRLSREAGFDFHLVKPVDPDALEQLIRKTQL
jgi:PAS domain S-box-containing protein